MRFLSPSLMLLSLIALPLPFLEVSCAGHKFITQNGIQTITGEHTVATDMEQQMGGKAGAGGANQGGPPMMQKGKKVDSAFLVIVWAGLLVVGALLGFLLPAGPSRGPLLGLLAAAAAACLLAQGFVLKFPLAKEADKANAELKAAPQGMQGFPGGGANVGMPNLSLETKFGPGFWLGVALPLVALAAAFAGGGGDKPSRPPSESV